MADDTEDIEVIDTEGYSSGKEKKKSFRNIVLDLVSASAEALSKEMTTGGKRKRISEGIVYEDFVPNTIEIACNTIRSLKSTLIAEVKTFPEDIVQLVKTIKERLERLSKAKDKKIMEILSGYNRLSPKKSPDGYSEKEKFTSTKNLYIEKVEEMYEHERLELYIQLYESLMILLHKVNYFEEL